jgi:ribosomal protein L1
MATGYPRYAIPELETIEISSNSEHSESAVRAGDDVEDENLLSSIENNVSAADFEVCIANAVIKYFF